MTKESSRPKPDNRVVGNYYPSSEDDFTGNIPVALTKALEKRTPEQILEVVAELFQKYPKMFNEYVRIQRQLLLVFAIKQRDYGPGNIALGTRLETQNERDAARRGVLIRTNDKINRMLNLDMILGVDPLNETLADSWEDTTVYGTIAQLVMRNAWGQ